MVPAIGQQQDDSVDPTIASLDLQRADPRLHVPDSGLGLDTPSSGIDADHRIPCPGIERALVAVPRWPIGC